MILTITLNPSVDIRYKLDPFHLGQVNRVQDISKTAGGKGLNVTRVLHQLNVEVAASGFLGGSLGDFIRKQIGELGVRDFFIPINGETRNCIAMIHDGKQTEILENGPLITEQEAGIFLTTFAKQVEQADMVTISGSLPRGLPVIFYQNMLNIAAEHETPVLLDTNGSLLRDTLQGTSKPWMIKPNQDELADVLGKSLTGDAELKEALKQSIFADIPLVVVTLGASGAMVKYGEKLYRAQAPTIDAVNPVGSGDSVVAGFAAGLARGLKAEEGIQFGLSMGVLNAMEEKTGHINPGHIDWCMRRIAVTRID